jgi:TRAP-type C4-dicarboxylate transport system permease small subunit
MKRFLLFCEKANWATMAGAVFFLLAAVVICFIQVVTRTTANFSFRWAEELTRYIVIFAVFLASGTMLANDEHPRVEIIDNFLSRKAQLRLNYFYHALILLFLVFLCYYGWQLAASATRTMCSSIRIPWAVPFSAVFLGGVNMLIQVPARLLKTRSAIARLARDGEEEVK